MQIILHIRQNTCRILSKRSFMASNPATQCINKCYVVQENCDGGVPPNYQSQAINGIKDQLSDVWPSYKGTLAVSYSLVQLG